MRPLGILATATLATGALAGYLALERRLASSDPGLRQDTRAPAAAPAIGTAPDPERVRDVFRFGDRGGLEAVGARPPEARSDSAVGGVAQGESLGPRLVGFVRRSGRLLAAFAVDGGVELAAEGDSISGLTVLSIGEDGVRVRRAMDGAEATLPY